MHATQVGKYLGQRADPGLIKNTHQLPSGPSRVGQRTEQIKQGADTDLTARADRMACRAVMGRGKHKA